MYNLFLFFLHKYSHELINPSLWWWFGDTKRGRKISIQDNTWGEGWILYRCICTTCQGTLSIKCLDLFGKTGRLNLARKPGNYGRIELWGPEGINEVISRLWQRSKARSIPDNSSNVVLQFAPPRRNWTERAIRIFPLFHRTEPEVTRGFIAPVNFSTLREENRNVDNGRIPFSPSNQSYRTLWVE